MYAIYSLLILILGVIASPYLAYQAIRYKKYVSSFGQRMGYLPVTFNLDGEESIWIHAVSVGEALTVRALIADLKQRYPKFRIFLSTTTMAGQQVARRNVQDIDAVFYFPFDLSFIVRRTLRLVNPRLFIMMETEIWPNLLRECKRRNVATVMVNGRISSRSIHATSSRGHFSEECWPISTGSACRARSRHGALLTSGPTRIGLSSPEV